MAIAGKSSRYFGTYRSARDRQRARRSAQIWHDPQRGISSRLLDAAEDLAPHRERLVRAPGPPDAEQRSARSTAPRTTCRFGTDPRRCPSWRGTRPSTASEGPHYRRTALTRGTCNAQGIGTRKPASQAHGRRNGPVPPVTVPFVRVVQEHEEDAEPGKQNEHDRVHEPCADAYISTLHHDTLSMW